ncbi:iron-containing alcohol dehydrogenase [Exiguobacterium sp. SL14]|nr:iron-containing alcohol dehydrogenase [Exiguobacterium sp. SL14]MCY1690674.1 iron-containing alcohol dehydrogenase [Exiguobacterium sp. SL14]
MIVFKPLSLPTKRRFGRFDRARYPIEGVIPCTYRNRYVIAVGASPALRVTDRIWIITDETVRQLHLDTLQKTLAASTVSATVHLSTVVAGEQSKSLAVYGSLLEEGIHFGMTRHSIILAFGGGMIGDLAGFVAATFLRGIPFIQVPTTLLAHDSSVGGKVGLNLALGKNLVGAFYQPSGVVYDLTLLQTLPDLGMAKWLL